MFRLLTKDEEIIFRRWARRNYTPGVEISEVWHPVVQDECRLMCEESGVRFDVENETATGKDFGLEH